MNTCSVCNQTFPTARQLSSHIGRRRKKEENHRILYERYVSFVKEKFAEGQTQQEIIDNPEFPFNIGFIQTVWRSIDKKKRREQSLLTQARTRKQRYDLPDIRPTADELKEFYEGKHLTCQQIANIYNCNRTTIESWIVQLRLNKRKQIRQERADIKITDEQRAILLGTTLGDAHIRVVDKERARLYLCHGQKQKTFLEWKVEKLKSLFGSFEYREQTVTCTNGTEVKAVSIESMPLPQLKEIHDLIYDENGQKHITRQLLEQLGLLALAVWFQDDGSRTQDVTLHVCSFLPEEIDLFIQYLLDKYEISAVRTGSTNKYGVLIYKRRAVEKFLDLVRPFVCDCLKYKVDLEDLQQRRKKYRSKVKIAVCEKCHQEKQIIAKGFCCACYRKEYDKKRKTKNGIT